MNVRRRLPAVAAALAFVLAGCQGGGPLLPWTKRIDAEAADFQSYLKIQAYAAKVDIATPGGGQVAFGLPGGGPDGFRANWETSRGTLSANEGYVAIWTAPASVPRPLIAYVHLMVHAKSTGSERWFRIRVDAGDQVKVEPLDDMGYLDDTSL